ncbi:hypothetical protein A4H97_33680 [Niastella yeongjuensis]|uniref:CSD domain-containing protein n=1 Tax=Niastella yeongjuensis TaxID=354355 RepID=A0A1V9EDW6_9BACT|nr:hypothetical protein [Niastella yeongjuensis]OQP44125.1 hypothetical protein A4H97_33680 [Niastella yeongjuensis]SEP49222.1 hypothetical protein SAMN05660816_06915 [Niastella yeongjuensis]
MKDIDAFDKYITELAKDKKYPNIVVSFKNTVGDFSSDEVSSRKHLVKNIIDAHRHEKLFNEAFSFVKEYGISIETSQHKAVLSSYAWLVYAKLDDFIKTEKTDEIDIIIKNILSLLPCLNLSDDYYDLLLMRLIGKIVEIGRLDPSIAVNYVFEILKVIGFRKNTRLKEKLKKDDFVLGSMIRLFGKSGYFDYGFKFLKFLQIDIFAGNVSVNLANDYGWLLYYWVKEENKHVSDDIPEDDLDTVFSDLENERWKESKESDSHSKDEIFEQILRIFPLLKNDSKYSSLSRLFNLCLRIEKGKANKNWKKILAIVTAIDVNLLTLDCRTSVFEKNGKERRVELASDKESWYSAYSNALYQTEDYVNCLNVCQDAYEVIPRFHYNNEIWFARRIALCKRSFGNIDDAIFELEKIVKQKKEWFIQKEIAELYYEKGDYKIAKEMLIVAALNRGDLEKKDALFFLLGKLFIQDGNTGIAYKHFLLSLKIRQDQQFRIPQELKQSLEQLSGAMLIDQDVDAFRLYKELLSFWKSLLPRNNVSYQGKIFRVINEKEIGFIKGDDNQEFFFRYKDLKFKQPIVGMKVKYKTRDSRQEGKHWIAFDIHPTN